MPVFKRQFKFFRGNLYMSQATLVVGCILFVPVLYFIPKVPMSFYSIHDGEDDIIWRFSLSFLEWYIYPIACGLLITENTLICITYRTMSNCVKALDRGVQLDLEQRYVDWIKRQFQVVSQITNNLSSGFSFSLLCQEFGWLLVISYLFVSSSRLVHGLSAVLGMGFYCVTLGYCCCLFIQFYPMVVLNLNSMKFVRTCTIYLSRDKYSKRITKTFRELKVRPMKVHTITLNTMADYVLFVASFILMLLKR